MYKIILQAIVIILSIILLHQCKGIKDKNNIIESTNYELKSYRDKDSLHIAKMQQVNASFKLLKKQFNTIDLKRKTKTVTVFKTITKYVDTSNTIVLTDTVIKDNVVYLQKSYNSLFSDKWITLKTSVNENKTTFDLLIKNEFDIRVNKQKSLLRNKPSEVVIKSLNKYTETTDITTLSVKQKVPLLNLGVQLGYGYSILNRNLSPYVGLGIGFNLVR